MQSLPAYISIAFVVTTIASGYLFYRATNNSKTFLFVINAWLILQASLAASGFYTYTAGLPPRLILAVLPPLACIGALFVSQKGRRFVDTLNIQKLTLHHTVRIPVELVLLLLYLHEAVPQSMTFEGSNFDILSGITAPLIYLFSKSNTHSKVVLTWNIICLALLLNIVITAVLAAPSNFQQIAFDQPNIAILYFPFIWLPACVVPLVLLSHLATIRIQLNQNKQYQAIGG